MWRPFLSHLRRRGRCAAAAGEGTLAAACCSRASSRQQTLISPRAYSSSSSSETMAAAPPCNGSADDDLYQIRTPPWSENMHHPVGCRCCRSPPRRRHLYLILDEMHRGYGIYKLDLADLDGGDDEALAGTDHEAWSSWRQPPRRLPEASLRLSLETAHFESLGAGSGSGKIVVTGYGDNGGTPVTLVYDTSTAKLDMAKPPPDDVRMWRYHAVAAGDRLFALDAAGGPCYLCQELAVLPGPDDDLGRTRRPKLTKRWAWKRGSSSRPSPLPHTYDGYSGVQSYAVHPDGRTVFVSTDVTFSLDAGTGESAARGPWLLPFQTRAYYDGDLGAWVGVRAVWHGQDRSSSSLHLCSCDVPDDDDLLHDDDDGGGAPPLLPAPKWKLCEQELTFRGDDVRSGGDLSRALVHTGRGRFCLVETWPTARSEGSCHCTCSGAGVEHLLLVTMFRAKHGKEGELVVSPCRPGRSYIMPNYCSDPPVAFWM